MGPWTWETEAHLTRSDSPILRMCAFLSRGTMTKDPGESHFKILMFFKKGKQKIFLSTLKMHEKNKKTPSSVSEMQKIILCMDTECLMLV